MTTPAEEPIDLIAIQMAAEEMVRAEYDEAWKAIDVKQKALQRQQVKWNDIVATIKSELIRSGAFSEDDLPDAVAVVENVNELLEETFKLKKMFKMINENELLLSQWNKLVMSIRLLGGDENV